jgi:HEPN superfamily RiboL-PSP-like protein
MVRGMSKPYTEQNLSDRFDDDLIWRRKELSDIKLAIKAADAAAKPALLRALVTMCYAHWEGYVRNCATSFFEFLSLRKLRYTALERQLYVNSFLVRLDALNRSRVNLDARCKLVNEILDGSDGQFRYLNPDLIDTKSNLSTNVIKDICLICGIDGDHFEDRRPFIDVIMLKRRNAIAHGQEEYITEADINDLVDNTLALMQHFSTLLENKIYMKAYLAA